MHVLLSSAFNPLADFSGFSKISTTYPQRPSPTHYILTAAGRWRIQVGPSWTGGAGMRGDNRLTAFASGCGDTILIEAHHKVVLTDIHYRRASCEDEENEEAPD